jgi:hypothetical protein
MKKLDIEALLYKMIADRILDENTITNAMGFSNTYLKVNLHRAMA